jgi:hypothetical protein
VLTEDHIEQRGTTHDHGGPSTRPKKSSGPERLWSPTRDRGASVYCKVRSSRGECKGYDPDFRDAEIQRCHEGHSPPRASARLRRWRNEHEDPFHMTDSKEKRMVGYDEYLLCYSVVVHAVGRDSRRKGCFHRPKWRPNLFKQPNLRDIEGT